MKISLDNREVPVECVQCGHKSVKTIGDLKVNGDVTCAGCGAVRRYSADEIVRAEQSINRELRGLSNVLSRFKRKF